MLKTMLTPYTTRPSIAVRLGLAICRAMNGYVTAKYRSMATVTVSQVLMNWNVLRMAGV